MPHLHEEEVQVLAGLVLLRREEVKTVIWAPGYMTTSMVEEVRVAKMHILEHAGPEQGWRDPYSCQSEDEIFQGLNMSQPHS